MPYLYRLFSAKELYDDSNDALSVSYAILLRLVNIHDVTHRKYI